MTKKERFTKALCQPLKAEPWTIKRKESFEQMITRFIGLLINVTFKFCLKFVASYYGLRSFGQVSPDGAAIFYNGINFDFMTTSYVHFKCKILKANHLLSMKLLTII